MTVSTDRLAVANALSVLDHARAYAYELAEGDEVFVFRASPDIDRCENDSGYTLHVITESTHDRTCSAAIPPAGARYQRDSGHRGMCWTIKTDRGEHYNCSPYNTGAFKVGHTR